VLHAVGLRTGCVAGALEKAEYEEMLEEVGFEDVTVEVTSVYVPGVVEGLVGPEEIEALRRIPVASAFVRARRPHRA
jgi:arsenite methyltransferase